MGKAGTAAVKAAGQADRAKRAFQGIRGIYEATIRAKDDATAKLQRVKTELNGLKGKAYTVAINVKQNGDIGGMKDKLSGMAAGAMAGLPVQAAGFAGLGYGVFDAVKNYSDSVVANQGSHWVGCGSHGRRQGKGTGTRRRYAV